MYIYIYLYVCICYYVLLLIEGSREFFNTVLRESDRNDRRGSFESRDYFSPRRFGISMGISLN